MAGVGAELAGVALGAAALVPPAIALINFWTDFIGDTKRFGEDSQRFVTRFSELASWYSSLQSVLFDPQKFSFVKGSVYQDLSETDQALIMDMMRELPRILYEYYLVETSYGIDKNGGAESESVNLSMAVILTPDQMRIMFGEGEKPESNPKSRLLSFRNLWWAARTKKRVEELLVDYEDWLNRIKSTVERAWWPRTFTEHYANLQVIENDPDCQAIGVAETAGLKRLLLNDAVMPEHMRLEGSVLRIEQFDGSFRGVSSLKQNPVFVEWIKYQPTKEGFIDERLERRFREISSLLNRARDPEFCVLHCRNFSITEFPEPEFRLIYDLPEGSTSKPKSLKTIIESTSGTKPSLGSIFRLCYELARSLSLFHSVGWIHRSIRSENILFFNSNLGGNCLIKPYICGFEACRLEEEISTGPWDDLPERNVYRHPDRWGIPKKSFTKYHDIYGMYAYLSVR